MANVYRNGFGQVEPNHLSAQKTGQIYAQLPADDSIQLLENGQFVKYDYAAGKVDLSTSADGEYMMVFNEVHTYDERDRYYKDFAMVKSEYNHGIITPRVIKTNVGDIFTTNTLKVAGAKRTDVNMGDESNYAVGKILQPNADGYLEAVAAAATPAPNVPQFKVVKVYTLADGQFAVKVQRVA